MDSPEDYERTIKEVPEHVAFLYSAYFCQFEVCNGGFSQFFSNSTGVLAPEAVEAFKAIGQPGVADFQFSRRCLYWACRTSEADMTGGVDWTISLSNTEAKCWNRSEAIYTGALSASVR